MALRKNSEEWISSVFVGLIFGIDYLQNDANIEVSCIARIPTTDVAGTGVKEADHSVAIDQYDTVFDSVYDKLKLLLLVMQISSQHLSLARLGFSTQTKYQLLLHMAELPTVFVLLIFGCMITNYYLLFRH